METMLSPYRQPDMAEEIDLLLLLMFYDSILLSGPTLSISPASMGEGQWHISLLAGGSLLVGPGCRQPCPSLEGPPEVSLIPQGVFVRKEGF